MIREFDFRELNPQVLEEIARCFAEQGIFALTGLGERITAPFRRVLADTMGVTDDHLTQIIDPAVSDPLLPQDVRQKMSRVLTTNDLASSLLTQLLPVLKRLIGPFVQVSRDFHAQFKGGIRTEVDYGGYASGVDYMEVHRPYMLHQDFTGANLPTSPSAITLWAGLNGCSDWNVRFYPASHLQGLLCNRFIRLDDPRLEHLGEPIDVRATPGSLVMFNALMLHGTSNPGPGRRVSCDIRFFPLCPYLGSEVNLLDAAPYSALHEALKREESEVLLAPLLEAKHWLDGPGLRNHVAPLSVLNWPNYLFHSSRNDRPAALASLEKFVNPVIGTDAGEIYAAKYFGRPVAMDKIEALRARLAILEPGSGIAETASYAAVPLGE
jgi:hypothetical protein